MSGRTRPILPNPNVQSAPVRAKHGLIGTIVTDTDAGAERSRVFLDVAKRAPFVPFNPGTHLESPVSGAERDLCA